MIFHGELKMKLVFPSYYKAFKCDAGECKDTCCAGWQIVVDEGSAKKYSLISGEIGEKLCREMKKDSDGATIFKLNKGRCPFLNQQNLCDIYSHLGESYLCKTCKNFPRFIEEYALVREVGIGLACPQGAKLILKDKAMTFENEEIEGLVSPNEIDPKCYFSLIALRSKLIDAFKNSEMPFKSKLSYALALSQKAQKYMNKKQYDKIKNLCQSNEHLKLNVKKNKTAQPMFKILNSLEILTPKWRELISLKSFELGDDFSGFENIAVYFIYRYFLKAVFDGDLITKVKFCVFSCVSINVLCQAFYQKTGAFNEDVLADIAHLFSKEVEYCQENMSHVYKALKGRSFSVKNMISMVKSK